MSIESMGSVIAALRKEKNATQEELADFVGVSAQAVSKWENGGAPDSALLPSIADFFGVSVDTLFGRNTGDFVEVEELLRKRIHDVPESERLGLVDHLCFSMQTALFGDTDAASVEEYRKQGSKQLSEYHSLTDGYTLIGLDENLPYYLILRKNPALADFTVEIDAFCEFFNALSDRVVLDSMIRLMQNPIWNNFTEKKFAEDMGLDTDEAKRVIEALLKYHFIYSMEIEIDGVCHYVYRCNCPGASAAVPPILLLAQRVIEGYNQYSYFVSTAVPIMK